MKKENEEGKLPNNINEVIDLSIKRVDLNVLQAWLCNRGVKIKIKNQAEYKTPSYEEINEMISDTIKHYYFDSGFENLYVYGQNIDCTDQLYMGGISLIKRNGYFEIDFDLITPDELRNELISISYLSELNNSIRYN